MAPVIATPRTAHALRPAVLAHQREALGVVQQGREIDQIDGCQDGGGSSHEPDGCLCSSYHIRCPAGTLLKPPPRKPIRAVFVMEGGTIAERGTNTQLLAAGGRYARM